MCIRDRDRGGHEPLVHSAGPEHEQRPKSQPTRSVGQSLFGNAPLGRFELAGCGTWSSFVHLPIPFRYEKHLPLRIPRFAPGHAGMRPTLPLRASRIGAGRHDYKEEGPPSTVRKCYGLCKKDRQDRHAGGRSSRRHWRSNSAARSSRASVSFDRFHTAMTLNSGKSASRGMNLNSSSE